MRRYKTKTIRSKQGKFHFLIKNKHQNFECPTCLLVLMLNSAPCEGMPPQWHNKDANKARNARTHTCAERAQNGALRQKKTVKKKRRIFQEKNAQTELKPRQHNALLVGRESPRLKRCKSINGMQAMYGQPDPRARDDRFGERTAEL